MSRRNSSYTFPLFSVVTASVILSCGRVTEETARTQTFSSSAVQTQTKQITLNAKKFYRPSRWEDGKHFFELLVPAKIPESLKVIYGNSGNHKSFLYLREGEGAPEIKCEYKGGSSQSQPRGSELKKATLYKFVKCDNGWKSGEFQYIKEARLRLDNGGNYNNAIDNTYTEIQAKLEFQLRDVPPDYVIDFLDEIPTVEVDWANVRYHDGTLLNEGSSLNLTASKVDEHRDFIRKMKDESDRLTNRENFEYDDEGQQGGFGLHKQEGLAYALGAKDETVRFIRPPSQVTIQPQTGFQSCGDELRKGPLTVAPNSAEVEYNSKYRIYGLDCSGMLSRILKSGGIANPPAGSWAQSQTSNLNSSLTQSGLGSKIKAMPLDRQATSKTGDIVAWSGHIGIAISDGNNPSIAQSNGAEFPAAPKPAVIENGVIKSPARPAKSCAANYGPNRGPRMMDLNTMEKSKDSGYWGKTNTRIRFMPIPVPESLSKGSGPIAGGEKIKIAGDGFYTEVEVQFGDKLIKSSEVKVLSFDTLELTVPAGTKPGKVKVKISNVVDKSPQSTVLGTKELEYEYASGGMGLIDLSPAKTDSGALDDLINDGNNKDPEEVEKGSAVYFEGSGLGSAQWEIPGYPTRLSASKVTVPSTHPLFSTGNEVYRLVIPSDAPTSESLMIRALIISEGVEQSFTSPRSVKIKDTIFDWEIRRTGVPLSKVPIKIGEEQFSCPDYNQDVSWGFQGLTVQNISGKETIIPRKYVYDGSAFCHAFSSSYQTTVNTSVQNGNIFVEIFSSGSQTTYYNWKLPGFIRQSKKSNGKCEIQKLIHHCVITYSVDSDGTTYPPMNTCEDPNYTAYPLPNTPTIEERECKPIPDSADFDELWIPFPAFNFFQPHYGGGVIITSPHLSN